MSKGITPVVAIILLLIITIVIVGFSFTIFQGVVSTSGDRTENATQTAATAFSTCANIEAVDTATRRVYVRNCGSGDLNTATLALFAGDYVVPFTAPPLITPSETGILQADFSAVPEGTYTIRVTTSGLPSSYPNVYLTGTALPQPPSIAAQNPGNGATYTTTDNIPFQCDGQAGAGQTLTSVELLIDLTTAGTLEQADIIMTNQQTASLTSPRQLPQRSYIWNCRVTQGVTQVLGQQRTLTVNTPGTPQPPSVTLLTPPAGASYTAPVDVNFSCSASDPDGTISQLRLFTSTGTGWGPKQTLPGSPLNAQLAVDTPGSYDWSCEATDDDGSITTATNRTFTVTQQQIIDCSDPNVICIGPGYENPQVLYTPDMLLSQSDVTYVLMEDVTTTMDGFEMTGSNSILDGNGHSLSYVGADTSSNGVTIAFGSSNTVKNLVLNWLEPGQFGIILRQGTNGNTIRNNYIHGSIQIGQNGWFTPTYANNNVIEDNPAIDRGVLILLDSTGNRVQRNTIRFINPPVGWHSKMVYLDHANSTEIVNNTVEIIGHNPSSETFLVALYNSHYNTIRGNMLSYPGDPGNPQIKGIWMRDHSSYNLFEGNVMVTASSGIEMQDGNEANGGPTHHNTYRNNVFKSGWPVHITRHGTYENMFNHNTIISTGNGYGIYDGATNAAGPNSFIGNTIVAGPGSIPFEFENYDFMNVPVVLRNNIFLSTNMPVFEFGYTISNQMDSTYNLFYRADGGSEIKFGGSSYDLSWLQSNYNIDQDSLEGNPLFVDQSGEDFHLQFGSPAKDNGVVVPSVYCGQSDDVNPGQTDCMHWNGVAPDIGVFEYIP